jgi:ion channel-forming bestrophin family protein
VKRTSTPRHRNEFWHDAFALNGSITLQVTRDVLIFTLLAQVIYYVEVTTDPKFTMAVEVAPYEVAGAALGLLLVLRMNAGYDRWWDGRKLWGGIVNDCRTLATNALAYGPDDDAWRGRLIRWTIAYAHAVRHSLRGERDVTEIAALVGSEAATEIAEARHMPTAIAARIAGTLRMGYGKDGAAPFPFLVAEQARARLLDHVGGCERIMKSPLPRVLSINIRRFIFLFLVTLPFAMLTRVGWLTPYVTLLVAYPILAIDRIGISLQNPFDAREPGCLPLDEICATIEADLLALASFHILGPVARLDPTAVNASQSPVEEISDES